MSRSRSKETLDPGSTGKAEVKKETSIEQVEEPRTGIIRKIRVTQNRNILKTLVNPTDFGRHQCFCCLNPYICFRTNNWLK